MGGLVWYESAKEVMAVVSWLVSVGMVLRRATTNTLDTGYALARCDLGHQHLLSHRRDQPLTILCEQDRPAGVQRFEGPR